MTNEDIARFAAAESDLYVSGSNIKITGIQLIKYTDELLWSGNKTYDDTWKENIEITNDKLANIKVGDHLCIEVSALTSGGMVQILNNWEPFTPKVEYIFNESHSAPMTIHFVVSQAMINAWSGNTIRVRGANYTVTEVFYRRVAARKESYTLDVTSAGMATLVLPFNVPSLPDGVKAYNLSNDGSEVIEATEVTELKADKPVLIIAEQGPYEFVSELGGNADISGKNTWPVGNYENEAMVGNYTSVFTVPNEAGYPKAYNYILQHGAYGVGFYRVIEYGCTLAPYRAYLSCDYPTPSGSSGAPKLRMVFRPKTPTGISNEGVNELANEGVKKVLRDGQVIIIRNGAEYNVSGQCVK